MTEQINLKALRDRPILQWKFDHQKRATLTETELLALVEAVEAARGLADDWAEGGKQRVRLHPCGDESCGYQACELARALARFSFGEQP